MTYLGPAAFRVNTVIIYATYSPWPAPTNRPSSLPSIQPTKRPSDQPSRRPSSNPSNPTMQPTSQSNKMPSVRPSRQPSRPPLPRPSEQPSLQPSEQPGFQPTEQPSLRPTMQPRMAPSRQPIKKPSVQPSTQPKMQPSSRPSKQPSYQPSKKPMIQPVVQPSAQPSSKPSMQPTRQPQKPSGQPSSQPTTCPSAQPVKRPSIQPSKLPSKHPTMYPSLKPSQQPSAQPAKRPSYQPATLPSALPSSQPLTRPSIQPSEQPDSSPTRQPVVSLPSSKPSKQPVPLPTIQPSMTPTIQASSHPTIQPHIIPTCQPTEEPSILPNGQPSNQPTVKPLLFPSLQPSTFPLSNPSTWPSCQPTATPTVQTTTMPTMQPSRRPTEQPRSLPSVQPSRQPSMQLSTKPSTQPTLQPVEKPSGQPSQQPTTCPSAQPFKQPSMQPSKLPSKHPTMYPSLKPSQQPSAQPAKRPSYQPATLPSALPSSQPLTRPSIQPSGQPDSSPTRQPVVSLPSSKPSKQPVPLPTIQPSMTPTIQASSHPTIQPLIIPTCQPTEQPSILPSSQPSNQPFKKPTLQPSYLPTVQPGSLPSLQPVLRPSITPSLQPSTKPKVNPSLQPSPQPGVLLYKAPPTQPTRQPSIRPITTPSMQPSKKPSQQLSKQPSKQSFVLPSEQPSKQPIFPPTALPSHQPSLQPSQQPKVNPSRQPSSQPSMLRYKAPSTHPSRQPSKKPSKQPSKQPTQQPLRHHHSMQPSCQPSRQPFVQPSKQPSKQPILYPTVLPSHQPSLQPSKQPKVNPSRQPVVEAPSAHPIRQPSKKPSKQPSHQPTQQPLRRHPSIQPTSQPTFKPSSQPASRPSSPAKLSITHTPTNSVPSETGTISSKNFLSYFNLNSQLTLTGTIFSHHKCVSNWTVQNSSMDLVKYSLVSGVRLISPMQWTTVTLVLKSSVLSSRNYYQIDLRCGHLCTSVVVISNMPPAGGRVKVSPPMGIELETFFLFKAMNWTDKDLPLSYQFRYDTTQNYRLGIGAQSQYSSSTTSLLPSGSDIAHYAINCSVEVFDFFAASSVASGSVVVRPVSRAVAQAFALSTIKAASNGFLSLSSVNLLGTLLNKVNCSGSPNCAMIHRSPCSTVDRTCGSCLTGYIGEEGAHNTPCINSIYPVTHNSSFLAQQKQCLSNCSEKGVCIYVNSNTGRKLASCALQSTNCQAVCACGDGFVGSSCSFGAAELEQRQQIRSILLTALLNMTNHLSSAAITTVLAESLSAQTTNPDELNSESTSSIILSIASTLISYADKFKVDQYVISQQILVAINAIAGLQNLSKYSLSQLIQILQRYILFASSQLYPAQESVENVFPNFKTSVGGLSSPSVAVPLSALERFMDARPSTVDVSELLLGDISLVQATRIGLLELQSSFIRTNRSFLSNPLLITHVIVRSRNQSLPQNQRRFILVTLVHSTPRDIDYREVNVSTVCHRRQYLLSSKQHRYVCPSSGYVSIHNCTGKVGVVTTTCPRYQPTCSSLFDIQHPSCQLVSFSLNSTICNCSLSKELTQNHRRLNSRSETVVESTVLQIVASGYYIVNQVGQTLSASPSLASLDTLEHSYIVISMCASLWFIGIALVMAGRWTKRHKTEPKDKSVSKVVSDIREDMAVYLQEAIPVVFRGETSAWKTVVDVFRHHNYVALLWTENIDLLHVTRVVTIQSMLMFVLAVTYDLQSPSDDGSCSQLLTEETCLSRKSYLDSTQSYCQWGILSTDDMSTTLSGYACSYEDPVPTAQEVLAVSVLVSIITAVFLRPVEFVFKVLEAPIANRVRVQPSPKRKTKQSSAGDPEDTSFAELMKNRHISKIAGVHVREISESTIAARAAARKSLYHSSETASGERTQPHGIHIMTPSQLSALEHRNRSDDTRFLLTDCTFSKNVLETSLARSISRTRQIVFGQALDEFDSQWGILHHTETILAPRSQASDLADVLFIPGMFDKIYVFVESVRNIAMTKIEALRVTTEEQTGLEIFQLFIGDLLGRDSPAAKIFESKLGEDFEEKVVVNYNKKVLAGAVLVTMNILFAYYSILYGSVRGEAWQMIYLGACLAQFFVEICINETLECLWLHYIVPKIAAKEVIAAHRVLVDLVETFCRADAQPAFTYSERNDLLNAPDYLFVSTNVAKAFPSLMESMIIQSYLTQLPGESTKQWRMSPWQRFLSHIQTPHMGNMFLRLSMTVFLTVFALLEYGATTPYLLQKMFVRFCQPFLVSGIMLAFYLVIESPLYIMLFFLSAMVVIFYANRQRLARLTYKRLMAVTPLPSSSSPAAVNNEVLDEAADDLSISYSISSESLASAEPSTGPVSTPAEGVVRSDGVWDEEDFSLNSSSDPPSPLNSSEEGSFYNSLPDSSTRNPHRLEAGRCCEPEEVFYLSVDDDESDDDSCGSGDDDNHSSDDGISIHTPSPNGY